MKTKELVKEAERLGYQVVDASEALAFYDKAGHIIGGIRKNIRGSMDTLFADFSGEETDLELQQLMYEYSQTPLDEREDDDDD